MKKFNHHIIEYNAWKEDFKIVLRSKKFDKMYDRFSLTWYHNVVLAMYPEAKLCKDTSLTGYHFEVDDNIIELR